MQNSQESEGRFLAHYYGTIVRQLFLIGGILMLLTLPFFQNLLPVPSFISVLAILLIGIAAGFTSPRNAFVMILNLGISLVAFVAFEYRAVVTYSIPLEPLFLANQFLAAVFFFALYYSAKTVRARSTPL